VVVVVCRRCWIFGNPSGRLLKKALTLETTSSMSSGQTLVLRQPQKSSSMAFDLSLSLFLQQLDFTQAFLSLCLQRLPLPLSHKQQFLRLYSDFLSHAVSTLQRLPLAFLSPCLTNTLPSFPFCLTFSLHVWFRFAKKNLQANFRARDNEFSFI